MTTQQAQLERLFRGALAGYLFVLVLIMYPFTNNPTNDIKELLTAWAALTLVGGWVAVSWAKGYEPRRTRVFGLLGLLFLAWYAIAIIFSPYKAYSLIEFVRFFALWSLFWLAVQLYRRSAQLLPLIGAACTAVAIAAVYAFMQAAGWDIFPWGDTTSDVYTNLPATFGNPNFAAHTLILTIILALAWLFWVRDTHTHETALAPKVEGAEEPAEAPRKRPLLLRWLWLPGLFVAMYALHLLATEQRAGILALCAAGVVAGIGVLIGRRAKKPVAAVLVTLAVSAAVCAVGFAGVMAYTKARTGYFFPLDTSLLVRYQSYVSASDMILDEPLIGHGPGVYKYTYPRYWTSFEQGWFAQERRKNAHVHNDLMELAIDAGLPAAGLYLAVLVMAVGLGLLMAFTAVDRRRRILGYAFAAFFTAFAVDGLFGFNLRVPVSAALFFVVLGALEGLWLPVEAATPVAPRRALLAVGRLAGVALLLFAVLLQSRVFASEYYLHRGMRAQAQNPRAAQMYFHEAEDLAPWNAYIARRLALLELAAGDPHEAVDEFERSLAINPDDILVHLGAGHAKMLAALKEMRGQEGALDAALRLLGETREHAEHVLNIVPNYPDAEEMLGKAASYSALMLAGASDDPPAAVQEYLREADAHLMQAIRYGAERPSELYLNVAKVRITRGDGDGAREALSRAAQANASNGEVWPLFLELAHQQQNYEPLLGVLYNQIDRLKEAEEVDQETLVELYLWLSAALDNSGASDEAVENVFWNALQLQPERPEVWANFANHVFDSGRAALLEQAVTDFVPRLEEEGALENLGQLSAVYAVLQRGPEALETASLVLMDRVRRHPPGSGLSRGNAYGWAAQMLLNEMHEADAEKIPCMAYLNLGITFAELADLQAADSLFRKADACLTGPERAFLALYWADVLLRLQKMAPAIDLLEQAAKQFPMNYDVRWALARTLAKDGQFDRAREVYQELLLEPDLDERGGQRLQAELEALP